MLRSPTLVAPAIQQTILNKSVHDLEFSCTGQYHPSAFIKVSLITALSDKWFLFDRKIKKVSIWIYIHGRQTFYPEKDTCSGTLQQKLSPRYSNSRYSYAYLLLLFSARLEVLFHLDHPS